jgi:hypothetical protein
LENLTDAIALSEREESIRTKTTQQESPFLPDNGRKIPPWDDIFADKDIDTTSGLTQAYLAFKQTEPPWRNQDFFTEAMRRVPVGSEPGFIEVVADTPELSLCSFRTFLERVPGSWRGRPAISHAIASALKVICRRYCMDVRKYRYYEVFPFELACLLADISQAEIIDVVLAATGETSNLIDTGQLFSLVGLLSVKLSHDEALDALTYGLDLFSSALEDKDGDGPWSDAFSPPGDPREAIAGYIWAALAAPEAVLRWEAAHAVLELFRLGREDVTDYLMRMANTQSGGPFVDARLPFYSLHALQWLLIGLARAALEIPGSIALYANQLADWALKGQPHVLIRQFAARAALQLIENGYLADENGLLDRLKGVNKSPLPIVDSTTYERRSDRKRENNKESDEDQFYFGMDIGPYWYAPLGRVFSLSQGDVEAEALRIIRQDFGFSAKGRWDDDGRARRKLYDEQGSYPYKGGYPRFDNLHFYYCYHAMMIVAGRLLATVPTHRNPDYGDDDEFTEWLSGHDLTHQSSRWLWDRRDPEPLTKGTWLCRDKEHPDHWQVTDDDFNEALQMHDRLNLWGHWTEADAKREQSVSICSALVKPEKSEALLRALFTTKDVHDYAIPSAGSDMEIDESDFELKGWVFDHCGDRRLDKYDRWSGGISFPPPRPATFIIEQTKIENDSDLRIWKDHAKSQVMESQVWGYFDEAKRHESTNPNRGSRLNASVSFVSSMLNMLDRDLIIEVQIERRRRYQPYTSSEEDDEQIQTRAKLFLLDKDGHLRTC